MSVLVPFFVLDQPCDQVLAFVNRRLTGAGFYIMQTFDLQVARQAHPDCPCPFHGIEACGCQMIVLLIYQKKTAPVTLVIYGQDGKTWLSLANSTGARADKHMEAAIQRALILHLPPELPSSELPFEARSTG